MKTPFIVAFASVVLLLTQQPSTVAGKWKVSSNVGGTASEQTCTFTQKEDAVAGTCEGDRGPLPVSGKVDGKNVTWQFNTQWEGQTLTVIYSGALESPAKMTGTVDVQPLSVSGEFSATLEK